MWNSQLFVENHFSFTIFSCFSFFKIIECYAGSLRGLLSLLLALEGFPIQTVAAVENVSI